MRQAVSVVERSLLVCLLLLLNCNRAKSPDDKTRELKEKMAELSQRLENDEKKGQQERDALQSSKARLDRIEAQLRRQAQQNITIGEQAKRAMADVRFWAASIGSYYTDHRLYPRGGASVISQSGYSFSHVSQLGEALTDYQPYYPTDPWGRAYLYWCSPDQQHFLLVCTGQRGILNISSAARAVIRSRLAPGNLLPQIVTSCIEDNVIWLDNQEIQLYSREVRYCK